jgi:hypothetical protein
MSYTAFVALVALTVSPLAPAVAPSPGPNRTHAPHRAAAEQASVPSVPADRLFALRERRRIAAYLRMRLLEMREEGLGRAADAVRRRLPADVLSGTP